MRRAKIARADDRRHFLTLLSGAGAALHVGAEPALHCHDREQGDWLSIIAVDKINARGVPPGHSR
jgi:hypothetical protein